MRARARGLVRGLVRPLVGLLVGRESGGGGASLKKITWVAPANAAAPAYTGYRIYKSTDGGATYSLLNEVGDVTTYDIDAVTNDKVYVASYNDAGEKPKDASAALELGEILTIA